MSKTENSAKKQKHTDHLFQPDQSGNPKGKPLGAKNHATRLAEKLIDGQVEALVRKAVELALSGDTTALKHCLERILPPRRDRPVSLTLPEIKISEDVIKSIATLEDAVGGEEITPSEGKAIIKVIEVYRRTIETVNIEKRLAILRNGPKFSEQT